jgi:hypothetical protein
MPPDPVGDPGVTQPHDTLLHRNLFGLQPFDPQQTPPPRLVLQGRELHIRVAIHQRALLKVTQA